MFGLSAYCSSDRRLASTLSEVSSGHQDSLKNSKELNANIAHGRFDLRHARKEFLPLIHRIFEVEPARRITMEKVGSADTR